MVGMNHEMKAISGELILGWHRATRGPLMGLLIIAAILCLGVLPGLNDEGLIYTRYGLGLYWMLLLFTSLWCGGTAYALDRERHRLALTFTKPLHRLTLWWGRWLAVWIPFIIASIIACICLSFRPLPEGRLVTSPRLPDLHQASIVELARLREQGRVPPNITEARLLKAVYDDLESRYSELRPDIPRSYRFDIPYHLPANATATLRLSGAPFPGAKDALKLLVEVPLPDGTIIQLKPERLLDSGMTLTLPPEALVPGKPLSLTLLRLDHVSAASVLYREYHDLTLLLPGRPPLLNLMVFTLVLILTTALTTALGVSFGCMFSLPVTLFAGVLALLACTISIFSPSASAIDSASSLWAMISTTISETLANPFIDLIQLNPLNALLEGEALSLKTILVFTMRIVTPALLFFSTFSLLSVVRDEDR